MRILLSFLQDNGGPAHGIPSYRFWSYYIKNGIEEAGMQWTEVPGSDWAEGLLYREGSAEIDHWKAGVWESTVQYVRDNISHIDLFLTYLYPKQVDISAIRQIRALGIPCVNFYCDNIREFNNIPIQFKAFDLMWVPEAEAVQMYKKARINYIHLPMPMWVEKKFRTPINPDERPPVTFIGSRDILRERLLSDAIHQGLPVEIWGSGWIKSTGATQAAGQSILNRMINQVDFIKTKGLRSFVIKMLRKGEGTIKDHIPHHLLNVPPEFDDYVRITQNSKVLLGINQVPTFKTLNLKALKYSRLRDIEAPMLGACYLTEYCNGIHDLYDIGKEIFVYRNVDELIAQSGELLKNKAIREQLRTNGQKRALNDHSIPKSLEKLQRSVFK